MRIKLELWKTSKNLKTNIWFPHSLIFYRKIYFKTWLLKYPLAHNSRECITNLQICTDNYSQKNDTMLYRWALVYTLTSSLAFCIYHKYSSSVRILKQLHYCSQSQPGLFSDSPITPKRLLKKTMINIIFNSPVVCHILGIYVFL